MRVLQTGRPTRATKVLHVLSWLPLTIIVSCLMLLLLRFVSIAFETYEIVSGERSSDEPLLELCSRGDARASPRMQSACMQANAARASPMFVSVLVRASSAFVADLWVFVRQPMQAFSLAGAFGAMSVLPWLGSIKQLIWPVANATSHSFADFRDDHVVVVHNGTMQPALTNAASRKPIRYISSPAFLEEATDNDNNGFQTIMFNREKVD